MSERCLSEDYTLRGHQYELWIDGDRNWWLSGGHKPGWVLTESNFDPPLSNREIDTIGEYIHDWFSEE